MAHLSAFSASRCVSTSRLSSSEAPGDGRPDLVEHADLPARSVALDLLDAVLAAKLGLVDALDAGSADGVVGQVALVAKLLQVISRDRTAVADEL